MSLTPRMWQKQGKRSNLTPYKKFELKSLSDLRKSWAEAVSKPLKKAVELISKRSSFSKKIRRRRSGDQLNLETFVAKEIVFEDFLIFCKDNNFLGLGCGIVGRAVASSTRDRQFESQPRQNLQIYLFICQRGVLIINAQVAQQLTDVPNIRFCGQNGCFKY